MRDPGLTYRNAGSDMASCRTAGIVRDVASCVGSGGDVGVAAGCGVAAWSSFRGVLLHGSVTFVLLWGCSGSLVGYVVTHL